MKFLRIVAACFLLWPLAIVASITSQTAKSPTYVIASFPSTCATTFPFQAQADLLVLDIGPASGLLTPAKTLALNSDYTVTGGGYNSSNGMLTGSVVVVGTGANTVAVGDQIVVLRNVPVNQIQSFTSGPLTISLIEQALDKTATISQQLTEQGSRSLRLQPGEALDGTLPLGSRKNAFLAFDNTGAPYFPQTASIIVPSTAPVYVTNIAALKLLNPATYPLGTVVHVGGYNTVGDGGGGDYLANPTSTATDNGGTVIQATGVATGRWLYQGQPTVKTFGAKGDGSSDDTTYIAATISWLNATASGANNSVFSALVFPAGGKYAITAPLVFRISNLRVDGNGCELIAGASMTAMIQLGQTSYPTPQSDSFNDLLLNCNNNASYGFYVTQGASISLRTVNVSNPVSAGFYAVGSTTTTIDGIDFINCLVQIPGTTAKGFFFNQGNITPGAFTGFHLYNCGVQGGGIQVETSGSSSNYAQVNIYGGIFDNAASYCFFATSFGAIETFGTFGETNNQPTAYASVSGKIYALGGGLGPNTTGQATDGTGIISQIPDVYGVTRIGSYFNVTVAGSGAVLVSSLGTSSGTALSEFFGSGGKSMQIQTNSDGSINVYTGATTGTLHSGGTNALSLDTTGTLGLTNNLQLGGTTFFGPTSADLNFNMRGSGVHRFTFNSTVAVASAQCGTFVANGATPVVVSNTAVTSKSAFEFGLITPGGTITAQPYLVSQTAGTGFTVQASAGDTSTYRYVMIEGN